MSPRKVECLYCGSKLEGAQLKAAPVRNPAASARPRRRYVVRGSVQESLDSWTRGWANWCGILLVVGFFCPLIISMFGTTQVIMFWDFFAEGGATGVIGGIIPLILAFTAFMIGNGARGEARAIALTLAGAGSLVAYFLLGIESSGSSIAAPQLMGPGPIQAMMVALSLMLSPIPIAVGNRVRKRMPERSLPRFLAGFGGCSLVLAFLIPMVDGTPLIAIIFMEPRAWSVAWPVFLALLGLIGYGILGTIHLFYSGETPNLSQLLSVTARVMLFGVPLAFLIMTGINGGGDTFITALFGIAKMFSLFYGHMLLIAIGLAAWMEEWLVRQAADESMEREMGGEF